MDRARKRQLRALNERAWAGEAAGEGSSLFAVNASLDSSLKKNTAFIRRLRTALSATTLPSFLQEIASLSLRKYLSEIVAACYEGLARLKSPADVEAGVEVVSALHQRFGPADFTVYLGWLLSRGLAPPPPPDRSAQRAAAHAHPQVQAAAAEARERDEKERITLQRGLLRVVTELWLVGVLRTLDDVRRPEDAGVIAGAGVGVGSGVGGSGGGGGGGGSGSKTDGRPRGAAAATAAAVAAAATTTSTGSTSGNSTTSSSSSSTRAAEPFPLAILKDLLGHDRDHANLPLLVTFVKTFSWDVLGVGASAGGDGSRKRGNGEDEGAEKDGEGAKAVNGGADGEKGSSSGSGSSNSSAVDEPMTPPALQDKFKSVLARYFEDVKGHLVRDQKALSNQSRRNAEAYVKSGEVFEDRQANFEKQVKALERLVSNAQVIADTIGAEMPDLGDGVLGGGDGSSLDGGAGGGAIGIVKAGDYLRSGQGDGTSGIWEDEEERRFYENLVDLKGKVPAILLEDGKKKKADADEPVGKKVEAEDKAGDGKAAGDAETAASGSAMDDQSTSIANKSIGAQVDTILLRLPDLTNKEAIDQTAIDFCFLNSKASRNRLIKALTEVPKGRSDLLPCWARLVATLGQYMPDVPKGVVEYLDAEFRSLQRRKDKDFLGQVRLSNIRYLAELTKFGIVPEHVVFHCLKVSLDDFSRMNIEIISNLLENCGRYLLRTAETAPRMEAFLETLQRKKAMQHIGQTERMLIENAVYYVDPPERPAIQQKERTPLDIYLRKLVYVDLCKRNANKILRQIQKLHWEEPEVVALLRKLFARPGKVKYGNIHLLAGLLSALYRHHAAFVVDIVDGVLESICLGLERNDFRMNQRRLAEVKYVGEFYTYRLLEHPVIFDLMYKILTLGHGGPPVPGRINPLDLPDEYFRIRLVATLLETTGTYFTKGAAGKKLDYFLTFFQYYIFVKNPLPMDVEFIVQDTFALIRPQWKLATSLEEASRVFQQAVAEDQKASGADRAAAAAEAAAEAEAEAEAEAAAAAAVASDDDESSDDEMDNADDLGGEGEAEGGDGGDDDDVSDEDEAEHSESEDEEIVVTREEELVDPEDEAEFEREYARMMAESLEMTRKFERKPLFDVALPVRPKARETAGAAAEAAAAQREAQQWKPEDRAGGAKAAGAAAAPTMAFSLLTKRGNRQQTRTLELPSDSEFAVALRNQQAAEREEQQRIKNLVLNLDLGESEEAEDKDRPGASAYYFHNRPDRSGGGGSGSGSGGGGGNTRGPQRGRKLQLSDVDW